ncbi:hypothetical protein ATO6_13695 [Oceanicola sp. 22II-s10i]|uniref:DUF1150 family protein n=1 Tax=Oceanicola sp. 22II-s10i TaxID=1317116 RepID=UPI000B5222C3|nr:DUF1150 family protein [Oceanicola sp. 22II-s10i]OWU84116.1 hypothetical protein ATO6_13695 [Oceanicola sp. 22II-s10i]
METKYEVTQDETQRIVYIRPVAVEDLPVEVRAQAEGADTVYAVHDEDGERLALVKDRNLAFILARQNDFAPVTVH